MSKIQINDLNPNELAIDIHSLSEQELALIIGGYSFFRLLKGIAEVAGGIFTVNGPLLGQGIDDIFQ